MRIDRHEAQTMLAELKRREAADRPAHAPQISADLLHQAKVATELLTGHPEWDVFLQRIQVWIDDGRKALAAMVEAMPPNLTSEQVLQAHRHIIDTKAKIDAWEQVLRLPKAILETEAATRAA